MKVKFTECSDAQASWGSSADPRKYLTLSHIYEISVLKKTPRFVWLVF